ncbi:MAG: methionyl-tRNA synthetase, partial [Solirubrobacterales bacterium]|nr:methionyl-tRNA synthetase [Solirubrobacterales bacterium]
DEALGAEFHSACDRVRELLDSAELTQALEEVWKLVRRLNQYVEERRPWDLAKDDANTAELDTVLYSLCEGLRVATLLLFPYMPATADRLLAALGEQDRALAEFGSRGGGQRVEKLPPLFPKLDA